MTNMQVMKANGRRYVPSREAYRATKYPAPPATGFWEALWIHKTIFGLCILACVGAAALYTFSSTAIYRARGSVELQLPPGVSDREEGGAIAGQTYDSYLQTQIGILQSDNLVRRVITRLNLAQSLNAYHPRGLVAVRQKYFPTAAEGPIAGEKIFDLVKGNLTVRQSRLNDLIEVFYDSPDPNLAANIVNALIDEYQQQNLETRWQSSQNAGKWFASHLTDLRKQLEASEQELQNYSRQNGLLVFSDDDNNSVAKARLNQLQEALSRAQSERIAREAEMQMSSTASPDAVPQVLDNAALKEYEVKIADLERQVAEYKQIYTPTNPKIQLLQSQIASLRNAWRRQQSAILARISNVYKAALQNEKMLQSQYLAQERLVGDQDQKMIRYQTLKHDVDTNRTIYESLLQKVKEQSVSLALQATNVRVVDAALAPTGPYKPNHAVNLASGLLAGFLLGGMLVIYRQRSDRRVRRPGIIQHYLTSRELGTIPSDDPGLFGRIRAIKSPGVRTWLGDPDSQISNSFRSVMTSIIFGGKDPSKARFAVITSPGPGEGKTTVASNLAAAFAATGRRVLLVDADLRRPHLHRIFDLPDSPGLSDFAEELQSTGPDAVQLDRYAKPTAVPGLFVITSGTSATGASNLLHALRFAEVFSALRQGFDTVLVDAPPLLSVAEARVIARLADGVVLVVRADSTPVDAVMAAENYIREDGGTVIGTILNDASQSSTPYYAGYANANY